MLVFDLLLLGALVATGGSHGGAAMAYLLLLNPADVFRILNVFSLKTCAPCTGSPASCPCPGQTMADGLGDGGLDCGATRPGELEIQTMTHPYHPPIAVAPPGATCWLVCPLPPSAPSQALLA